TGTLTVERAQFASLDPAAIDAAIRAVDGGTPIDNAKIGDLVNARLQAGKLAVPSATGAVNIASGRASVKSLTASAEGVDVALNGLVDLVEENLELNLKLTGAKKDDASSGQRPEVSVMFKGPIDAPRRTTDTSAFVGWLTLRSVDRETKRLEELQSKAQ